uniref:RING-type E3 ubiquitin transferase n=1 Tax=Leersia perrieri TaxID=77586 RepID=A0A0D9X3Q0_9ORYZ
MGWKNTGLMEDFSPRTLLNSILRISVLTSDGSTAKPKPIQKYCQNVCDISSIVSPLIEDLCDTPEEQLNEVLRELGTAVNEASGLIGNWHQTTSKIYFIWQIESVISDIQGCSLQLCQLVNSLLPSLTGRACTCIEKLQDMNYEHMFDLVKEASMELAETDTASPERLSRLSSSLSLSTNLELYMEAVSLENLRARAIRSENREREELDLAEKMIPLVGYMHDRLLRDTQLLSINGVPIPADFCCPLSLELMSDPVIVASGQTYERVYIKLWLDEGFTICPKTRQRLGHSNLIPNYTVKALIANWCESHDIKLPDPMKSLKLNFPSAASALQDLSTIGSSPLHPTVVSKGSIPGSPEADLYMRNLNRASPPHSVINQNSHVHVNRASHEASAKQSSEKANGSAPDVSRLSLAGSETRESSLEERNAGSMGQTSEQSTEEAFQASNLDRDSQDHVGSSSVNGSLPNSGQLDAECDNGPSDRTNYSSDASGEVTDTGPSASSAPQREHLIPSRLADVRSRGQFVRRPSSERGFPRIISSSSMDTRSEHSAIESQVRKLVDDLRSDSVDVQRSATSEIRLLAKHNMENRIVIANCGAVNLLVGLLHSPDAKIQEHAVTALLNLSINDNNKIAIANAEAVDPLIHVLETGNPEAKENSAATLFSLSVIEENKVRIGRSGAIKPLVDLLGNGTPRGKKDAATALFNLSILHENKARIVQADAVKYLVELMDPAAGMVDKAVAVLANLATIPEGRTAIGQARGIPALVEVVELGSARGKENAAAALLQLCTNSSRFCSIVLQEGAVPPLVALSQSGTPRAREKAQALLSYFRSQRHGNSSRR